MKQRKEICLLRIALVVVVILAVFVGCARKSPPEATVDILWNFTEGSSGYVAIPNAWIATTTIGNKDGRTWNV